MAPAPQLVAGRTNGRNTVKEQVKAATPAGAGAEGYGNELYGYQQDSNYAAQQQLSASPGAATKTLAAALS